MIPTLGSICLWAMAVAMTTLAIRRPAPGNAHVYVASAVILLACSLTLHAPAAYLALDGVLGGRNFTDLLARTLLVVGSFLLSAGFQITLKGRRSARRRAVTLGLLLLSILTMSGLFAFIDAPHSSAQFMTDFGDQIPTALFNTVEMIFLGVSMSLVCVAALSQLRMPRKRSVRVGYAAMALGGGLMSLVALIAIMMNALHVIGATRFLDTLGNAYGAAYMIAILAMSTGAILPPLASQREKSRHAKRASELLTEMTHLWMSLAPGHVRQNHSAPVEVQLQTACIGVLDALHVSEHKSESLSHTSKRILSDSLAILGAHAELQP